MSQIANSMSGGAFTEGGDEADGALELRVFWVMIATVALTVVGSTMLAPWRVTFGLMLGGVLSLLNYHWLRTSIAAVFSVTGTDRPRVQIWRYLIRYFVVGVAVLLSGCARLCPHCSSKPLDSFILQSFIERNLFDVSAFEFGDTRPGC